MDIDLTGKTAPVTGSTQGIGLAIAEGLANTGTPVAVKRTHTYFEVDISAAAQSYQYALPSGNDRSMDGGTTESQERGALLGAVALMGKYRPQSRLQRLIEPAEISHMVTYLASPLASATTGGALRVDGGYVDSIVP